MKKNLIMRKNNKRKKNQKMNMKLLQSKKKDNELKFTDIN